MVFSWIINALSKDIACSKIYSDKANEIWMDFEGKVHPEKWS